jgi:diguanylate cyclase (GGDEF)-like protein
LTPHTASAWQDLPRTAQAYVALVSAGGTVLIAWSASVVTALDHTLLTVLFLLAIPISWVKVRFPRTPSTLSMSHVLNYLALLALGTKAAVLVAAAGAWSQCTFRNRQRNAFHRTWFSVAGIALAMYVSGVVYLALGGHPGAWEASTALVPFTATATTYFIVNSGLVAMAIALATARSPGNLWAETFLSTWPSYLLGAAVAAAGVFAMQRNAVWLVVLVAVPFALSFHSLRAYLERVDEAVTDELTGLPNHRFVLAHAGRELDRAKRDGLGLTLVLADLDGFKVINDRYGHRAGDQALRQIARRLQDAMGGHKVCARYGGDEFLIVLSEHDTEHGKTAAGELQRAVDAMQISPAATASMSVGTATYPDDGDSLEQLLEAADARMYRDKLARGRHPELEHGSEVVAN